MEYGKEQELEQAKRLAWEIGNKILEFLLANGSEKYLKENFPNLRLAFVNEMTAVVCIDEGCAHKDYNGHGKFTLAGSGILFPAKSEEERIKIVTSLFSEMGIKNVTSHEGCGAAKMAYLRDNPGSSPISEQVNEYAKLWAEKVAAKIGAEADNIPLAEMERPAEFHNARVLYFDAIGGFNPNKEKGLPMGFTISRRHVSAADALAELKVAASIAFSDHGFGNLFTSEMPFIIIPLANNQEELDNLKKEVNQILRDDKNYQDKKIKVDGLAIK